jgi:Rho GTPase-activating protein 18/28/40
MRELLNFFKLVVDLQSFNKMSIHNVATITAPSFFPPRFVHPTDKNDISAQVRMAAQCCHLTNVLVAQSENLWMVPQRLIDEARKISKTGNVRPKFFFLMHLNFNFSFFFISFHLTE